MNEIIKVNYDNEQPTVSARELHKALDIKTAFKDWFPRMCEYGFEEGKDFCSFLSESTGGRPSTDHQLTLEMAKEICMIQRNEKGKQVRQYFITLEQKWNSPEMVISRALQYSQKQIAALCEQNIALSAENEIMKPKAKYFDELVERDTLTNIRDTAKLLGIKQNALIEWLEENKYIFRDNGNKIKPFQKHIDDKVFKIKQYINEKNGHTGTQTLVTPKGISTFRRLING